MKRYFLFVFVLFTITTFAQKPEKLLQNAIPVSELTEIELPKFPGYKSYDRGNMIAATEDAVRGYFIRKLDLNAGDFEKKTIVKMQVRFVIGDEGEVSVTNMQSEFEKYVAEGARIAANVLPKMTPANRNKKAISVLYDFPLIFVAKATRNAKVSNLSKIEVDSKLENSAEKANIEKE